MWHSVSLLKISHLFSTEHSRNRAQLLHFSHDSGGCVWNLTASNSQFVLQQSVITCLCNFALFILRSRVSPKRLYFPTMMSIWTYMHGFTVAIFHIFVNFIVSALVCYDGLIVISVVDQWQIKRGGLIGLVKSLFVHHVEALVNNG